MDDAKIAAGLREQIRHFAAFRRVMASGNGRAATGCQEAS
jgi:hypothetical protein